jgi:hypothetical protein
LTAQRLASFGTPAAGGRNWTRIPASSLTRDAGGAWVSATVETEPFDSAVLTWNGVFPAGSAGEFDLRFRAGGAWTPWRRMGAAVDGAFRSEKQPDEGGVRVLVDTARLTEGALAGAFEARAALTGGAGLRSLGVAHYRVHGKTPRLCDAAPSPAWGRVLDVKPRSQGDEDPAIARRICSPTATAMALEHFGVKLTTADVAARCYDPTAGIYGNWSVNASRAGELLGEAFVAHLTSFAEIEAEILAGRPVVLSHAWKPGDLAGAPLDFSDGHLVLVVGFDARGDVVVNDPAGTGAGLRRVFLRQELFHTWQDNASGVVYLFRPAAPASRPV